MSALHSLALFAPPVWQDFLPVLPAIGNLNSFHVVILDSEPSREVAVVVPDAAAWRDDHVREQVLLLTGLTTTSLDAGTDDFPRLLVEISSILAELVMDARNAPWPDVELGTAVAAVAEPAVHDGYAYWLVDGRPAAEIGLLATLTRRD